MQRILSTGRARTVLCCCAVILAAAFACHAGSAAAAQWTLRRLPALQLPEGGSIQLNLSGISCPSESLCVAVGGREGTLAFSRQPTGGNASWDWAKLDYPVGPRKTCMAGEPRCQAPSGALEAVSCASESICALVTYDGWIFVSTNPSGGSGTWDGSNVNDEGGQGATHLTSVSCPTPTFCAAVSGGSYSPNAGRVLTSTDPTAGVWQTAELGTQLDLRTISCGTPSLCVAAARGGQLLVSTEPTGGASTWKPAETLAGQGDLEGASCVSTQLCAVGNMTGNVFVSPNPAAGRSSWNAEKAGSSVQITGVSCPTTGACLAVDDNGDAMTSTDPTGGANAWDFENLIPFTPEGQPHNALFGASCPTVSLCALVGSEARIFTSTDPFSAPDPPHRRHPKTPRRPQTFLLFAEHFWKFTRGHHIRARFRFYSPTKTRGFECKRDRSRWRRCHSPLRYRVAPGRHALRVRAIGPTGLRGPAAIKRFRVLAPRHPSG